MAPSPREGGPTHSSRLAPEVEADGDGDGVLKAREQQRRLANGHGRRPLRGHSAARSFRSCLVKPRAERVALEREELKSRPGSTGEQSELNPSRSANRLMSASEYECPARIPQFSRLGGTPLLRICARQPLADAGPP